jgi:hypothetical protein
VTRRRQHEIDGEQGTLVDVRLAVVVKRADAIAVGVVAALRRKRIGRFEEPERRPHRATSATHREESAHDA